MSSWSDEINQLVNETNLFIDEVEVKRVPLDVAANSAIDDANSALSSAASSNTSAISATSSADRARGEVAIVESVNNFTASQRDAISQTERQASLVSGLLANTAFSTQDLTGINAAALHRSPNAITSMFIYDTSKDSDGGAWTEKCQHTSWWNEAINGKWLGAQASELDARLFAPTLGSELVSNGDFSSGATTGWSTSGSAVLSVVSGRLRVANGGAVTGGATFVINTVAGRTYQWTYFVDPATSGSVAVRARDNTSLTVLQTATRSIAGTYTVTFVAQGSATQIQGVNGFSTVGAYHEFDNVSVREVTAVTTASGDYYQSSADGRFYRLWRNLLSRSEEFDNAAWTKSNVSVSANAGTTVSGTNTADLIVANTADSSHYVFQTTSISTGVTYTASFEVKASGCDSVFIQHQHWGGSSSYGGVRVNLNTGAVINYFNGASSGATVTSLGSGWYRIAITFTSGSSNGVLIIGPRRMSMNNGTDQFVGNSVDGILVGPTQLELGSVATAYEVKTAEGSVSEVFRGNKRDFPRLAGIVAEASNVTIYDLTEPGRPMWMRFVVTVGNGTSILSAVSAAQSLTGVAMSNAQLVPVGIHGGAVIDFSRDLMRVIGNNQQVPRLADIVNRNTTITAAGDGSTSIAVVSTAINAVAMTVLPDAPVDSVTGLRVPTIDVFTAGGVSRIQRSGVVVSATNVTNLHKGGQTGRRRQVQTSFDRVAVSNSVTNNNGDPAFRNAGYGAAAGQVHYLAAQSAATGFAIAGNRFAVAQPFPLNFIHINETSGARSLASHISNTFNTGWMTGDIRRCFLSDIEVGSVTGAELVSNGGFDTDSGWTKNGTGVSWSGGRYTIADVAGADSSISQQIVGTKAGRTYRLTLNIVTNTTSFGTAGFRALLGNSAGATTPAVAWLDTLTGTVTLDIPCQFDNAWLVLHVSQADRQVVIESASLSELVVDRSFRAKNASITGTLTRAQLASGTSLVGYSGWSTANYLREPYSADLDFGTGEFTATALVNIPVTLPDSSFPLVGAELVTNGGFDTDTAWTKEAGWTISGGTAVWGGGAALNIISQSLSLPAGNYRLTFTVSGRTSGNLTIRNLNDVSQGAGPTVNANGTYSANLVASGAAAVLRFRSEGLNAGVTIDNVSLLRLGDAPIFDRDAGSGPRLRLGVNIGGRLTAEAFDGTTTRTVTTTAAYNTAQWLKVRINYTTDGTLAILVNGREVAATRGAPLLTMNSRYNLANYSQGSGMAGAWGVDSGGTSTRTDNAIVDPLGGQTAMRFVSTNSNYPNMSQNITFPVAGTYCVSFWAKVPSGTLTTSGFTFTDTWQRFSTTVTRSAATTTTYLFNLGLGAAIGVEIHVWGAQVELGSAARTYQRTSLVAETEVAPLTIGNSFALDAPFPGSIALLKLGATVPTQEQETFMYEQEKQLFRENAQCVLPDSGSIVDMSYDDATDRWVAVSASNESYWTGLVRNSVTPVPAGSYTRVVTNSGVELTARSTTNPGVDVTIPTYLLREDLNRRAEAATRNFKELVIFDYVGGFTASTTTGSTSLTSVANLTYPTSYIGARISGSGIPANTFITGVSGTTIYISAPATATATGVSISFLDFELPVGFETEVVTTAGSIRREGSTLDYTRLYDGFIETIRFATAPGSTAWVQIQAQRSSSL